MRDPFKLHDEAGYLKDMLHFWRVSVALDAMLVLMNICLAIIEFKFLPFPINLLGLVNGFWIILSGRQCLKSMDHVDDFKARLKALKKDA